MHYKRNIYILYTTNFLTMVNRLLHPQEVEVFYLLPAIRRELTVFMKAQGKWQKEIARLLGVTEPAISQYVSEKRASDVSFPKTIKTEIKLAAKRIKNQETLYREVQRILLLCRKARLICKVHEKLGLSPKNCTACFKR